MPIINYEAAAEVAEKTFFKNKKISNINKEYTKDFLAKHTVKRGLRKGHLLSPTRKNLVLRHLPFLLSRTKDLKKDMKNTNKIDNLFQDIRKIKISWKGKNKNLSDSYYGAIISVSLTFATWLNDGTRPEGFKNIQHLSRESQQRELNPEDMITWQEGEELIKATPSVQFKAIIATQLDGGFRPSEFVDLNFGDVKVKENFIIVYVRRGKGGKKRFVTLWRAVPRLLRWVQSHPTKKTH